MQTDGNSANSSLFSVHYSDSSNWKIQDHAMAGFPPPPSTHVDAMISFSHGQTSSHFAGKLADFSIGSSMHEMEGITPTVGRYVTSENRGPPFSYPIEPPKTAVTSSSPTPNSYTFESTNYGFEDLPFIQPVGNSILNEWISREEEDMSANKPGPSRFSKELSLSLASIAHGTSIHEQCSEMNRRLVGSENTSCSSDSLSWNINSCKQTLQLSATLSGSRFFHAMQEILAEIACYVLENIDQMSYSATGIDGDASSPSSCSRIGFSDVLDSDHRLMFQNEWDLESKKKHLLSLLQLVDDLYNQCLDEIHTVISAFHAVTELDPNLHARFALPTISLVYRNLRVRISSYILAMGANLGQGDAREESSFKTSSAQKQWVLQQLRKTDHQLWRPQRGLPEQSVSVLKAWMFQNFLHPYPKDAEKHLLALKSGLTRNQVSNWFINARVRLWKLMIEEMYAEMNRRKARRNEETKGTHRDQTRFQNRIFTVE